MSTYIDGADMMKIDWNQAEQGNAHVFTYTTPSKIGTGTN